MPPSDHGFPLKGTQGHVEVYISGLPTESLLVILQSSKEFLETHGGPLGLLRAPGEPQGLLGALTLVGPWWDPGEPQGLLATPVGPSDPAPSAHGKPKEIDCAHWRSFSSRYFPSPFTCFPQWFHEPFYGALCLSLFFNGVALHPIVNPLTRLKKSG